MVMGNCNHCNFYNDFCFIGNGSGNVMVSFDLMGNGW